MKKKRRNRSDSFAVASPISPSDSRVLDKQSRYGPDNWKPGQIPTRGLRVVTGPISDPQSTSYGESLGVERPRNRGHGKPREGDL